MEYNFIKVEKKDFRFILTLARPEKRNAFTPTMVNEIAHAFDLANADDAIKVVIIKAEGPIFCAGMDLNTFENPMLDILNPFIKNQDISLGQVFDGLLKPSIAIVEGNVIAGGFLIILGCSYVYCKKDVQFKLPEVDLGIFPFQVMAGLLKVLPEKKVLQLCLNTEYFDVQKAIALGIVDGFIGEGAVESILDSFERRSTKALMTGIKALRKLPTVVKEEQFAYLKNCLDTLKKD
ncbi:enoyl-CoA hydratase/isomerase family protein [Sphingobacterium pedocola]|uniref:Enoyl-CoA hydratase/isomerase family protein n=1 Tax=Sphingobacterium pedocola TaxID=2082722 RepID=A0ABR9T7Z4_9SPHI|nr:enoyl-CoA hydratase/isomerase family protein [Sphingobacterium pedocola]MBE8721451.1 enoyl-CoA hydratase/isomerase family protein [Sphingobacterium pedocola]